MSFYEELKREEAEAAAASGATPNPVATPAPDDGSNDMSLWNAAAGFPKMMAGGWGALSEGEKKSQLGITAPTAAAVAAAPFVLPAKFGTLGAMGGSWAIGRLAEMAARGTEQAYSPEGLSASDLPGIAADSVTNPYGLIDVGIGGLGGFKALGNVASRNAALDVLGKGKSGREVLTSLAEAGKVKGYKGRPVTGAIARDEAEGVVPAESAQAFRNDELIAGAPGAEPAPNLLVPEIEAAVATRGEISEAALRDPRLVLAAETDAAKAARTELKKQASVLKRVSTNKKEVKRLEKQLAGAEDSEAAIQIASKVQEAKVRLKVAEESAAGLPAAKELDALIAKAEAEVKRLKSTKPDGTTFSAADDGRDMGFVNAQAVKSLQEKELTGWPKQFPIVSSDRMSRLRGTWAGKKFAGLRAPDRALASLAKEGEGELSGEIAGMAHQQALRKQLIETRIKAEMLEKSRAISKLGNPAHMKPRVVDGSIVPSDMSLALDAPTSKRGAAALQRINADEGSAEAYRLSKELGDDDFLMKHRAGVKQSVDLETLANVVDLNNTSYQQRLASLSNKAGKNILPENLDTDAVAKLAAALGKSQDAFAKTVKELNIPNLKINPKDPRRVLTSILPKENYLPHRKMPIPREWQGNEMGYWERVYPNKTTEELDFIVNGGGQQAIFAPQRTGDELIGMETDIPTLLEGLARESSEQISKIATWGNEEGSILRAAAGDFASTLGRTGDVGSDAFNALPDSVNKEAFRAYITRISNTEKNAEGQLMRSASSIISDMLLTLSPITSMSEAHKVFWAGGGMTSAIRGATRLAFGKDKQIVKEVMRRSGAEQSPRVDLLRETQSSRWDKLSNVGLDAIHPMRLMEKVERFNRKATVPGNMDYMHRTAKRASEQWKRDGKYSRRTLKEAEEVFPNEGSQRKAADRLAMEYNTSEGQLSVDTYLEGTNNLARRQFFSTAAGFIGDTMKSSGGGLAFQYRSFMIQAGKQYLDDVLTPLFQGISDPGSGLATLGGKRLVESLGTAAPVAGATAALYTIATGDALDEKKRWETFKRRGLDFYFGGLFGLYGDAIAGTGSLLASGNTKRLKDLTSIPIVSTVTRLVDDVVDIAADAVDPEESVKLSDVVGVGGNLLAPVVPPVKYVTRPLSSVLDSQEKAEEEAATFGRGPRKPRQPRKPRRR